MLLPAAILIAVGLAGMAVDGTARYLTHRDLVDAADAAANDAVSAALAQGEFTAGQVLVLEDLAATVAQRSLAARADPILDGAVTQVRVVPGNPVAVEVTLTADVDGIFFPMLDETVTVTGRAELAISPVG